MFKTTSLIDSLPRHATKTYEKRDLGDILGITVHCDDAGWDPFQIAKYDISLGNHIDPMGVPACTYHTYISSTGTGYQLLDFEEVSWHAKGWNTQLVACVISYKATGNKNPPPQVQYDALVGMLAKMCLFLKLDPTEGRIYGHRELAGTGHIVKDGKIQYLKTCPGMLVDLPVLRKNVCEAVQAELGVENDGWWGPVSVGAFEQYQFNGGFND